ncbi:hypothetical protein [Stackebrandtia nassauensis]|uniref:Uncharacterized protein n=1 Tax=Stackebrandtia nassauensis (strain DSM 44728 / CIP 108903 / NRRL B-16338 / NBRC 102104 / LLR-40K-21) TaxID=446470 RepID=D3PV34_STANL|nr:hypothetical protein [Stackebrandtia nassauensis]ADD41087.1 hypothetical protein Snas_1380 [Stackebrandtia nassauensis DSM 44728]
MSHGSVPRDLLSTQSTFVCDLVPRLLALAGDPDADHPVVLLSGPSGSGHTKALETAQQCARHTPNVLVTFKKDTTSNASDSPDPMELLHLLAVMVSKLRRRYPRFGSIPFLRFQLCYDILTANIDLNTDPEAVTTVRGRVRQRIFGRIPQPSPETLDAVDKFATVASTRPPGLLAGMVWVVSLIKWPLWWIRAWQLHRSFRDMSTFTTGNDATQCLITLWNWFKSKRSTDFKQGEKALCEAFLADLGNFHRWHPRRTSCLVLLDHIPNPLNTDTKHPATRLLRYITALRANPESHLSPRTAAAGYGGPNPLAAQPRKRLPGHAALTIVAVTEKLNGQSRSNLRQNEPPMAAVSHALTAWQQWFPGNQALPKSWYCHTYLPPLTAEDVKLLNPTPPSLSDAAVRWLLEFHTSRPYVIQELIAALEKLDEPTRAEILSSQPSRRSIAWLCRELPSDIHESVHAELSRRNDPGSTDG